jgi:hypothetical protein
MKAKYKDKKKKCRSRAGPWFRRTIGTMVATPLHVAALGLALQEALPTEMNLSGRKKKRGFSEIPGTYTSLN